MSKIQITPKWSEVKPQGFYVYTHHRLSNGTLAYIGKGFRNRAWDKSNRSKWWSSVAVKNGIAVHIIADGLDEQEAFRMEIKLIAEARLRGEDICNLSDGGEGASGYENPNSLRVYSSLSEVFRNAYEAVEFLRANGYPRASQSAINKCCLNSDRTGYGRAWSYDNTPAHPEFHGVYRADGPNGAEGLVARMDHARISASAWHKSEAGRECHRNIGFVAWKTFKPKQLVCDHCSSQYMSRNINNVERFCSNSCKSAWRRKSGVDDIIKSCEVCGCNYSSNKYAKRRSCSRKCGVELRKKARN